MSFSVTNIEMAPHDNGSDAEDFAFELSHSRLLSVSGSNKKMAHRLLTVSMATN